MNRSILRLAITTLALLIVLAVALSFMHRQLMQLQKTQGSAATSPSR